MHLELFTMFKRLKFRVKSVLCETTSNKFSGLFRDFRLKYCSEDDFFQSKLSQLMFVVVQFLFPQELHMQQRKKTKYKITKCIFLFLVFSSGFIFSGLFSETFSRVSLLEALILEAYKLLVLIIFLFVSLFQYFI